MREWVSEKWKERRTMFVNRLRKNQKQRRRWCRREGVGCYRLYDRDIKDKLYDVVVVDPPTFSNSKRMQGVLDIQRDHAWILNRSLGLMSDGGILYFSNNFRKFVLNEEELRGVVVEEITHRTVPKDFHVRTVHRCWRMQKK